MLPITVTTEDGRARSRLTAEELTTLIERIGGPGDSFLVVERIPAGPEEYIQTRREGRVYEVECRDGGPEYHFGTRTEYPDEVAGAFLAWARGRDDWDVCLNWRPLQEFLEPAAPSPDRERLAAAFAALNEHGITARAEFACCRNCGLSEIRGEAAEGDHGFVFSFRMNGHDGTGGAAGSVDKYLAYGTYARPGDDPTAPERTGAVGREVVAALARAGLRTEWDGSPDRAIRVTVPPG
jgi:hypothetical protein